MVNDKNTIHKQESIDKIVFFGSHPHQGSLPQYIVTQTGMLISLLSVGDSGAF
jgi:hypothetical protein